MPASHNQLAEIAVGGMTCGACTSAVTAALQSCPGVTSANVSLVTERATVEFHDTDAEVLVEAVEDAGFDAELIKIKQPVDSVSSEVRKVELQIGGMTCTNCSTAVTNALEGVEGVQSVSVSLATDTASILFKGADPHQLVTAVEDSGFEAQIVQNSISNIDKEPSVSTLEIKIFGMNTENDVEVVRSLLEKMDGIVFVDVNLTNTLVRFDNLTIGTRAIFRGLEAAGFTALVAITADNSRQVASLNRVKDLQVYYHDSIVSFAFGVPLILIAKLRNYLPHFITARIGRGIWVDDVLSLGLTLPILLGPARRFGTKALHGMRSGSYTMDTLVTTSIVCAFSYSTIAFVHAVVVNMEKHQMYLWDACAMILMFVLLGKYLENLARGQTSQALAELISLVPEETTVIAEDTDLTEGKRLPTDMLQVGDIVLLHSGERISADGIVIEGESFVTESMVTGESTPVHKVVGDQLVGGTINGVGVMKFRVTNCGSDTKLAQIVSFIKDAQNTRAPIQRYADVASAKFVPAVLTLALLTFLGWFIFGLIFGTEKLPMMFHHQSLFFTCLRLGIAVVVVACPCALGLATPTAVMVATTVGAKHGILVKGGSIFEIGSKVTVVLFDKTGTLTTGNMSVVSQSVPQEYWPRIRALESYSEHPAGKALAHYQHPDEPPYATDARTEVKDPHVLPGEGISGTFEGEKMFVGRKTHEKNIVVVVNDVTVGEVEIRDAIRVDSQEVVAELQNQGIIVGILSGDSSRTVELVGAELGIKPEYTWSHLRPEDKVDVVESLQASGEVVAFVGDGINDSAALVSSSVGMSLEGSTHVAVESADIVLTQQSPVSGVPHSLDLCRVAMRRIKSNLLSSIVYNIVMIPFAMGLLMPFGIMLTPIMASAAMAMSSVSVVVSSLFLKTWNPDGRGINWRSFLPKFLRRGGVEYQPV